MIWSMPFFKKLFLPGGALSFLTAAIPLPGTMSEATHKSIVLNFNIIGQTGTAILLTIIITLLLSKIQHLKMQDFYLEKLLKSYGFLSLLFVSFWQYQS